MKANTLKKYKAIPWSEVEKRLFTPEQIAKMDRDFPKVAVRLHAEYLREVARDLKKARAKAGISQGELAARLHTSKSAISRIENGKQNLTMSYIARLAAALGKQWEIRFY